MASIFERRETITPHDAINLCLSLALDLGVIHHGDEERHDGRNGLEIDRE